MKKETNKDIIEETLENKIITTIMPEIKERVLKEVDDLTKTVRKSIKTIEVVQPDGTKKEETSIVHEKFEEILTLVNNNIPVMLTGGAGSGKSSTCEKVAKALRLRLLFQ
jgi:signal recognition particle GTPase